MGRDLARLPVDPSSGRMILQSAREGALPAVLVIAAGLACKIPGNGRSICRKPLTTPHRQFVDPPRIFLTAEYLECV